MDVRKKLVELLGNIYLPMTAGPDVIGEYRIPHKFKKEIADHLIYHGVTVQEWISTNERIPTEDDATDEYVAVVYTLGDSVKIKTISLVDVVIAHPDLYDYWMPLNLPQPPKGE